MNYPAFFDEVESIKLYDPLAEFLGAVDDGVMEFSYLDVVKSAGHSCPTVAGAYLMAREGLHALCKHNMPQRGNIIISFSQPELEGVAGVIANVFTQITGATKENGFKGLNGNFARVGLIEFALDIQADLKITRKDTGQSVEVSYDPSCVGVNPKQKELLGKIMQKIATSAEVKEFRSLWQERVQEIFNNVEKVITIQEV